MSGFLHSTPSFLVSLTSVPLPVCYSAFCHSFFLYGTLSLSPPLSLPMSVTLSMTIIPSVYRSLFLSLFLSVTLYCHFLCLSLFASVPSLCVYYFSVCHSLRLPLNSSVISLHLHLHLHATIPSVTLPTFYSLICHFQVCHSSIYSSSIYSSFVCQFPICYPLTPPLQYLPFVVLVNLIISARTNKSALDKDR